jgi:hypothetical protein
LSTRFLLELALKTRHVAADATYKLMFQGYSVFLVGINDMRRVFHATSLSICSGEIGDDYAFVFWSVKTMIDKLFFGEISTYRPTILIADGANAITNGFIMALGECLIRIMCWAHIVRAVDKRLSVTYSITFLFINYKIYFCNLFLLKIN